MGNSKQMICMSEWIDTLQRERNVCIYLPTQYYTSNKHYPTLIMQDGQNMSRLRDGSPVKWDFDLYQTMNDDIILVTIDSDSSYRFQEYAPFMIEPSGAKRMHARDVQPPQEAQGKLYVQWIVNTLLPKLQYRTSYYAIGGSSMGANISLYAISTYPHIFRYAALISPAYWFSCKALKALVEATNFENNTIYTTVGTKEHGIGNPQDYVTDYETINAVLQKQEVTLVHKIIEDGEHNEATWAKLVEDIVDTIKNNK